MIIHLIKKNCKIVRHECTEIDEFLPFNKLLCQLINAVNLLFIPVHWLKVRDHKTEQIRQ